MYRIYDCFPYYLEFIPFHTYDHVYSIAFVVYGPFALRGSHILQFFPFGGNRYNVSLRSFPYYKSLFLID